jgi:hypothetical protein
MKHFSITLIMLTMTLSNGLNAQNSESNLIKFQELEHQLADVMEIIDTALLKIQLKNVETLYVKDASPINKLRLGIIYHETALNFGFLAKTSYKGYEKKSYDVLSELFNEPSTDKTQLVYIDSYRASALSLLGGETKKLKLVGDAFKLFEEAIRNYASFSYLPEFLRGSVAENLPWFFFSKRKLAKIDMQSIINKQIQNSQYAGKKIMSFVYWAWANQNQKNKYRKQSLKYLDKAIALDPNYIGGRKRAEDLKTKLTK